MTIKKSYFLIEANKNIKRKKKIHFGENNIKTMYTDYQNAHIFVKYNPIWGCRRSENNVIVRHNYKIINYQRIECVDCATLLELNNRDIKFSIYTLNQRELRKLDKNKKKGDITIYAVRIRNKYREILKLKNKKMYIGQTISRITSIMKDPVLGTNRWRRHLDFIFNGNHHNSILSNAVKKYSNNNKIKALEMFEIIIFQIIKYQRDKEFTQEIADNAEKYWIGFCHTQFNEFGWNIEEGGHFRIKDKELINFEELDSAIDSSLDFHTFDRPIEYLIETLGKSDYIINNSIKFHYKEIYGEEVENYTELRKRKIVYDRIIPLIKAGYNSVKIENNPRIQLRRRQLLDIMKEVLKDPNYNFQEFQRKLLIKKIGNIIETGDLTCEKIANHFPALNTKSIELFINNNMNGIKEAVLNFYIRPKAACLLRKCSSARQLLRKLNWFKESSIRAYTNAQVNEIMQKIFDMTFEDAKLKEKRLRGIFKF